MAVPPAHPPRVAPESAVEVLVTPEELSFQLDGGRTRVVPWSSLTEIRMRTTARGVDLFWEFHAGVADPPVSMVGGGTGDNELLDGCSKRLRGVDFAALSAAMTATKEASFLLWSRSAPGS